MECFYHERTPAVGVCKNCQRGVCRTCAAEVADGIACVDRCEAQAGATGQALKRNALVMAILGVYMLALGAVMSVDAYRTWAAYDYVELVPTGFAAVLVVAALAFLWVAWRIRRKHASLRDDR